MDARTKSVLITGCSAGGIGAAMVEECLERGFLVFATARNVERMDDFGRSPNVVPFTLDVTSSRDIQAAVQIIKERTGGTLDVLINNAGNGYIIPALDCDLDQGRQMFEVNFWGPLALIQRFAPFLIAAKGVVVNVNSAATVSLPLWLCRAPSHISYPSLFAFLRTIMQQIANPGW